MLVGVPKEIKTHEYRVGLTTGSVYEMVHNGHQVIIETNAGAGIGLSDEMYRKAGAEIVGSAVEVDYNDLLNWTTLAVGATVGAHNISADDPPASIAATVRAIIAGIGDLLGIDGAALAASPTTTAVTRYSTAESRNAWTAPLMLASMTGNTTLSSWMNAVISPPATTMPSGVRKDAKVGVESTTTLRTLPLRRWPP